MTAIQLLDKMILEFRAQEKMYRLAGVVMKAEGWKEALHLLIDKRDKLIADAFPLDYDEAKAA